jgi:hypothetical protein
MIEIMNMRREKPSRIYDFRVDRGSPIGNPFPMKREIDRVKCCQMYRVWFYETQHSTVQKEYVQRLIDTYRKYGRLRLFCWCAPKQCHAEVIRKYILEKTKT